MLKQLARMPHAVREAGEKYLPATVAEWTYALARALATFYDECPVLKDDVPATMASLPPVFILEPYRSGTVNSSFN